jgi:hypothetical protein
MAQYKRSIQPSGFSPEQVSEKNISRLQEYSDRIIQSLREERDAVISNRNTVYDGMKENVQIEQQQAATNQKIQQQNINTQLQEQQNLSKRALDEYEMKSRANTQIFKDVANLSLTASKKLREIEIEKLDQKDRAKAAEIMMMGDNHPDVKALKGLKTEVQIEELDSNTKLAQAREQGLDDYDADKILDQLNQLGYHSKAAILNHVGKKWRSYLSEAMSDGNAKYTNPETGEQFSGLQASRDPYLAQIVASQELKGFEDIHGISAQLSALKQETGFYDKVFNVTQNLVDVAGRAHHADAIDKAVTDFRFTLRNAKDSADAKRIMEVKAPMLRSLLGNEGYQKMLRETGSQVDTDGSYPYDLAGMSAAQIGPNGEAWGERWKDQVEQIKALRAQGANAVFRQEEATKDREATQGYQQIEAGLLQQLDSGDAADDLSILATAEAGLRDKYGRVPKQFYDLQRQIVNENKVESEQKAALILEKIRTGRATQGEVLSIGNPAIRAQVQQEYNQAVKARNFGPNYDATLKDVKKAAMKIMGDSLEGAASFQTERLNLVMQQDFATDYKKGLVKYNGDTTRALDYASAKLEAEVQRAQAGDKKGRYYSTTGAYNERVFDNIEALKTKTAAQKDAAMDTLISTIGAVGINALESPGLLGNEVELRHISQSNATGQVLQFTPQINKAAKLLGITQLEATNAAIAAHNKVNPNQIPPLILDPSLQAVNAARPETQALFFDKPTQTSIMRGAAEVIQTPLRDPGNLRSTFRTTTAVTGRGYTMEGLNDAYGRPVVLDQAAVNDFSRMVQDSGGVVNPTDIASSQRSTEHNRKVGGAAGSPHLRGNALDIHGRSRAWMIKNGPKYGWYLIDYPGSHGGHFEYRPN